MKYYGTHASNPEITSAMRPSWKEVASQQREKHANEGRNTGRKVPMKRVGTIQTSISCDDGLYVRKMAYRIHVIVIEDLPSRTLKCMLPRNGIAQKP
jgi:hypothetical protein